MLLRFLIVSLFLIFPTLCTAVENQDQLAITKVLVEKSKRELHLMHKDKKVKSYTIALGGNPIGHKTQEGDLKTPEGIYKIDWRNPNSQFHKSLHISYPNAVDKAQAQKRRVSPGGAIFIHGLGPNFGFLGTLHTKSDWTLGCIAVTNEEIEEIWDRVPNGTVIEILP